MRLLADENVPGIAVEALRRDGHDLVWIRTEAPGSSDPEVLKRAGDERRILITFDKDFGELAYHHGSAAKSGIILFRIRLVSPEHVVDLARTVLGMGLDFVGHFTVVEDTRVRSSPLPGAE